MLATNIVVKLANKSYEAIVSYRQERDYHRLVSDSRLKSVLQARKDAEAPRDLPRIDEFLFAEDTPDLLDALKPQ